MGKQATTVLSLSLETPPSDRVLTCSAFTWSVRANEIVFKPLSGSRSAHQETIQERAQDPNTAVQSSSEADLGESTERSAQGTHQVVTRGEDEKDGGSLRTVRSEHF